MVQYLLINWWFFVMIVIILNASCFNVCKPLTRN